MEKINKLKGWATGVTAALTALWGWFGWLVLLWVLLMLADYLTGTAAAMRKGDWKSAAARDGIWHKAGSMLVVLVAAAADGLIGTIVAHLPGIVLPFSYSVLLCPVVVVWYALTEMGSILENAVALGAPAPKWLGSSIHAALDAVDKTGGKGDQ